MPFEWKQASLQQRSKDTKDNLPNLVSMLSFLIIVVFFQLDQQERDRIISIKEAEKKRATEELEKWKEQQRQTALIVCFSISQVT